MTPQLAAFIAATTFILLLWMLFSKRGETTSREQKEGKGGPGGEENLFGDDPSLAARIFAPAREEGRQKLGERLVQAGLYKSGSLASYLVLRIFLILIPVAFVGLIAMFGRLTLQQGLLVGLGGGIFGTIAPGFWLDSRRKRRQTNIRRALPDALDVVVVCVEGGLSMPAAFAKVTSELQTAHPLLAHEMAIVQREMQLGSNTGEALRNFSRRFDMAEIRGLASVVSQAEKFGSSIVTALRVHAQTLREQREFQAEELAAKAAVKILFPTLLFIFPVLFVVILGPAVVDIMAMLKNMSLGASKGV
jgi:tight adherence protein C